MKTFSLQNSMVLIILGLPAVLLLGCSAAEFSQVGDVSGKSNVVLVDDVLDDEVIDQDEDDYLDQHSCGKSGSDKKSFICHYPSGNIANAHTLCISVSALQAHVDRHGAGEHFDYVGKCRHIGSGNEGTDGNSTPNNAPTNSNTPSDPRIS